VYQHGKTVRTPYSALKYIHNQRRTTYRVAVVVSRKVHKSAVVRNRIRRRMYEIIREQAIHESYDLVFTIFSDQLATLPAAELTEMVHQQLQSAHIISEPTASASDQHGIVDAKESAH
jgi:ribonuclease P protein component